MAIRMTYITYTPEAHRAIIEGKQNREPVMRALIEDAGGKFIGFYGLIGRPAVRRMRTRIRLLAQPESMRSIVGATQREQRFD